MSMYTARCIVVRCDVRGCEEIAELLVREGASQTIPGWLEVYPSNGSSDLSRRKFICKTHAKMLDLGSFDEPAEIPLSQAIQNPKFQNPMALQFMAAMDPRTFGRDLLTGQRTAFAAISDAVDNAHKPQLEEANDKPEKTESTLSNA